jgi:glycosyltransferase involved in cell wall biosynthesis
MFYPFFMQRIVSRSADQVVAVSPPAARSVARAFDLPTDKIAVVWNGVDTDTFRRLPAVERERGRILFVGDSEDRNKGFSYLLSAIHHLGPFAQVRVVVVQRSWSKKAPAMVRELGLEDKLTFIDSLSTDELVREYNSAELVVSPSLYEGFGLPAAEAQACGTAVVATDVGAFPEIVEDGETGKIVPAGEAEPLAHAIRELLDDDALRDAMGAAGARRIRERFSWRHTAEQMVELYQGKEAIPAEFLEAVS